MVRVCIVKGCGNSDRDKISLHSLPRDPIQREKWLHILTSHGGLRQLRAKLGDNNTICDDHFHESCFGYGFTGTRKKLLDGAVPSLRLGGKSQQASPLSGMLACCSMSCQN